MTFRTGSEIGCYWLLQRLRSVSRGEEGYFLGSLPAGTGS